MLFEERSWALAIVAHKSSSPTKRGGRIKTLKAIRILKELVINSNKAWAFFDEASQGFPSTCGDGALLFFNNLHILHSNMVQDKVQKIEKEIMYFGYFRNLLKNKVSRTCECEGI